MTPRQQFFTMANSHGIIVEYSQGRKRHPRTGEMVPYELRLAAPIGKIFGGQDVHEDCSHAEGNACSANWSELLKWLQEDIIYNGFEDCPDAHCEWCCDT